MKAFCILTFVVIVSLCNQPSGLQCGTVHSPEFKSISSAQIKGTATNTDLAFWGTVLGFEDDGLNHALLSVRVDEAEFGHSIGHTVELKVGGYGFSNSGNPKSYILGEKYLFLCFKEFIRKEKSWSQNLSCYAGGVLCLNSARNNIQVCSGPIKFSVPDPISEYRAEFRKLSVPALWESSDLILRVGEVSLKHKPIEFSNGAMQRGETGTAPVVEVIKGELKTNAVDFRYNENLEIDSAPVYFRKKDVILFLEKGESGYTLVRNIWGFCLLEGDTVFTNKGVSTGYKLIDQKFVLAP